MQLLLDWDLMTATLATERWLVEGLVCKFTHNIEFGKRLSEAR
jgi:hypothetical protein